MKTNKEYLDFSNEIERLYVKHFNRSLKQNIAKKLKKIRKEETVKVESTNLIAQAYKTLKNCEILLKRMIL